jgi:nicotinamide riboside kinase
MLSTTKPFELAVLAPSSVVSDEVRLFQLLFTLSLSPRVIIAPRDLDDAAAWGKCKYVSIYRESFSIVTDRDQMAQQMLGAKTILVGVDDRFSGIAERLGTPFLFLPTPTDLPTPRDLKLPAVNASLRRIAIVGPECTGKSTLAKQVASALDTLWVPEYSRLMLEFRETPCTQEDLSSIIYGQIALEEAFAAFANEHLICDTEPRLSKIWSKIMYNNFPDIYEIFLAREYSDYLLTSPDLPWEHDSLRCLPNGGDIFFADCQQLFSSTGRPVELIAGLGEERLTACLKAIVKNRGAVSF